MKPVSGGSLRVVVITHGFYPRIGGAERLVASVSPLLQQRGVDVHILTRRLPGAPAREVFDGIPLYRLPVPGPKALASLSFTLAALPLILRLKPGLIHAHELISPATTAILAGSLLGCPVIATVHRSGPPGDVMRMRSRPLGRLRMRWLRGRIDRFVVISRAIDGELAAEGVPERKRVWISNGVDVRRFFPLGAAEKLALRRRLQLSPQAVLAVFTGRLAPEKQIDALVEVWPELQARFPQAGLLVVGSGPEEAALKTLAARCVPGDSIRWLGAQDEVAPFLQASDFFVLPSRAEGLSVALLEAMACALPAAATDVGGARDVIIDGQNGRLVPPGDKQALCDALLAMLADEANRLRMGRAARQSIQAGFSLENTADQLYALYQEVGRKGDRS
jgi:glycosyltransferase involved in cell wall biosynthesis